MPSRLSGRLFAAAFAALIALVVLPAVASAAPPSNDNFADAATLSVGDVISGTNLDATSETGEPTPTENGFDDQISGSGCSTPDQTPGCASSVWYVFHAPETANYTIATCDEGTDIDTILGVFTGTSLGALTQVAANDQGPACAGAGETDGSLVSFDATAGTDYKIQLSGYRADRGSFWLRAYRTDTPPAASGPDTEIATFGSYAGAFPYSGPASFHSGPRHSASFSFAADQVGASFECSLDGAAFSPCSSPVSYDVTGSHQFAVRSVLGGQADPTPAVQRFTVDGTPPDTSFAIAPPDPATNPNVDWTAASTEASQNGRFLCAVDGEPLGLDCGARGGTSPFCTGAHQVRVAAVDDAFNVDPTPAQAAFQETGGNACSSPTVSVQSLGSITATRAEVDLAVDPKGEGGSVRVDWGTTSAYGSSSGESPLEPTPVLENLNLAFLHPATLYHYKVTVTTPQGTADTGDRTLITQPGTAPSVTIGTPVVVGNHAAALPLTLDAHGASNLQYGFLIDPASDPKLDSRYVFAPDPVSGNGPQARTYDLVDLDPGVTYHVRAFLLGDESAESGEVTFPATPGSGPIVQPPPIPPIKPHPFKFRRSSIKLGRLSRHSKFLALTVKHLPPRASVGVTLNASVHSSSLKRLLHKQARANHFGVAKFKVRLSKKARKLLRNRHVKSLSLTVTVKPSGQRATHITLHPKLRR